MCSCIMRNIPYCTEYTSKYKSQVQPILPYSFICDNKRHYYAPVKAAKAHQCETDNVLHNAMTLTKISGGTKLRNEVLTTRYLS
jgi:hypothetical protein